MLDVIEVIIVKGISRLDFYYRRHVKYSVIDKVKLHQIAPACAKCGFIYVSC